MRINLEYLIYIIIILLCVLFAMKLLKADEGIIWIDENRQVDVCFVSTDARDVSCYTLEYRPLLQYARKNQIN